MNAEQIRNTFGHNQVYGEVDEGHLLALQIMALGELAAQCAETIERDRLQTILKYSTDNDQRRQAAVILMEPTRS